LKTTLESKPEIDWKVGLYTCFYFLFQ